MQAASYLPVVGKATSCAMSSAHNPVPLRFVWHHILPQVCGGQTIATNLVSVCDSCHYAIHRLLWDLKTHEGVFTVPKSVRNRHRAAYAYMGYDAAKAAGTVDKIPNEGGD